MKTIKIIPVLLLAIAAATIGAGQVGKNKVYACGLDDISSCFGGIGTSPYAAGEQDGIWDHQHGLVYNPVGQCSTCSDEDFQNGYSAGWNSYESQESTQGAEVNVVNSPGAQVSVNQGSNEGQQQNQPVGCGDFCGGGCSECGGEGGPCSDNCGGPPVGPCDFGCDGPYFHHWGWHHFWHFGSCGFGCSGPYRHIDFGSGDP
jgi:hypothetical protein